MFTGLRKAMRVLAAAMLITVAASAQQATSLLTNKSGGTLSKYDVVVVDTSNNAAFTTTTTSRAARVAGIVYATSILNNATGAVALPGQVVTVRVTGLVTRGDYIVTSTTAGAGASGGTTNIVGAFAIALETGTTTNIRAYVFTPTLATTTSDVTFDDMTLTGDLAIGGGDITASGNTTFTITPTSSGDMAMRFNPVTGAATNFANVDYFRTTNVNSASANGFRIFKGDNTATVSVTIQNNPSALIVRDASGVAGVTLTGASGAGTFVGDVAINGDDLTSDGDLTITPAGADTNITGQLNATAEIRGSDRVMSIINTTFSANDTTPTIQAGNLFTVPGTWTAGNNITAFDDGVTGQVITVIGGDSDCTVVDGSTLVMAGNWVAAANATLTLHYNGSSWFEKCRSAN